MTRDAAAQAVHERLEHAVSGMPAFDVDAGWTALAAQLEGPVAPVIPLRRHRPRRMTALAVAAAVFIGGSALAMVRHGSTPGQAIASVATLPGSGFVTGPHVHVAFSGAPPAEGPASGSDGPSQGGGGGSSAGPSAAGGSSNAGSGGSGTPSQDAPDDIDHGSGNDGNHDDNGQGNNSQWHQGGQGSSGGQGSNDQGSNGQGSNGQ